MRLAMPHLARADLPALVAAVGGVLGFVLLVLL